MSSATFRANPPVNELADCNDQRKTELDNEKISHVKASNVTENPEKMKEVVLNKLTFGIGRQTPRSRKRNLRRKIVKKEKRERKEGMRRCFVSCSGGAEFVDNSYHKKYVVGGKVNVVKKTSSDCNILVSAIDEVNDSFKELCLNDTNFPPLPETSVVREMSGEQVSTLVEEILRKDAIPPLERNSPVFGNLQVHSTLDEINSCKKYYTSDEEEEEELAKVPIPKREVGGPVVSNLIEEISMKDAIPNKEVVSGDYRLASVDDNGDYSVILDSIIAMLMTTSPVFSFSGVSDVILFSRALLYSKGDLSVVRLAILNFCNTLQARYGSDFIQNNISYYKETLLNWFDKLQNPKPYGEDTVIWGDVQFDEQKVEEKDVKSFIDTTVESLSKYLTDTEIKFPDLPEWKDEWSEAITGFKSSSLYYSVMSLIKNATALFMLLSFLEKDKAKEMLDKIIEMKWYKSIKVIGATTVTFMGILAICKEVNAIRKRYALGEPLFGSDAVLEFHKELNEIIASCGEAVKDVTLSEDGRTIIKTENSIRLGKVDEKIRVFERKAALNMRPDERSQLVAIEKKLLMAKKICADSFAANSKRRKQPFAFSILGLPGIGKSLLIGLLHEYFGMLLGLPTGNEYMYVKTFASKYDDMYKYYMWHATFDDFGQVKPAVVPSFASAIFAPIAYNNTVDNPAVKAVAEEKDKFLIHPKVLSFSANSPREAIKAVVVDEFAVLRRMGLIVYPSLRKEFQSPVDPNQLDYVKFVKCMTKNEWPDGHPWHFQVAKFLVGTANTVQQQYALNNSGGLTFVDCNGKDFTDKTLFTFPEFMHFMKMRLKEHQMAQSLEFGLNPAKCAHCKEPLIGHMAICDKEKVDKVGYIQTSNFMKDNELINVMLQRASRLTFSSFDYDVDSLKNAVDLKRSKFTSKIYDFCDVWSGRTKRKIRDLKETVGLLRDDGIERKSLILNWRKFKKEDVYYGIDLDVHDILIVLFLYLMNILILFLKKSYLKDVKLVLVSCYMIFVLQIYLYSSYFYMLLLILLILTHALCSVLVNSKYFHENQFVYIEDLLFSLLKRRRLDMKNVHLLYKAYRPSTMDLIEKSTQVLALVAGSFVIYKMLGFTFGKREAKKADVQLNEKEKYPDFAKDVADPEVKKIYDSNYTTISNIYLLGQKQAELAKEEEEEKLRQHFRCIKLACAIGTAAHFAKKSRYSEPIIKEKCQSICYIAQAQSLCEKKVVFETFSAYRYGESINIPRHGFEYWKGSGLFNGPNGKCRIRFISVVPGYNRPDFDMEVVESQFFFDHFDFASLKVSHEWGPQAKKLDALFWDVDENFFPNLIGNKGFVYAPRRNEFVEIKFRYSTNHKVILQPNFNGIIYKTYDNPNDVKMLEYTAISGSLRNGDCHSPIIAFDAKGVPLIVGVHTQLYTDPYTQQAIYGGYVICKKLLDRMNEGACSRAFNQLRIPEMPKTRVEIEGPMHDKCILNTRQVDANIQVVGKAVDKVRPTSVSRVQKTKVYDRFISWLNSTGIKYGPPILKAGLIEGVWVDPMEKPLNAYNIKENVKPFPIIEFNDATDEYFGDVARGLKPDRLTSAQLENIKKLEGRTVLNLTDTINGVGDGTLIPPINFKTSAGSEWPGGKEAWLDVDETETILRKRPCFKLKPEVQKVYDEQFELMRNGRDLGITYTAQAKDEVREEGKKARIFYMMQFTDMLRHRSVHAVMQFYLRLNRVTSENYIGLNCSSKEWGKAFNNMKEKSRLGTDKDFKDYDVKQKRVARLAVVQRFWKRLAGLVGYSDEEVKLVEYCGIEECFAYTLMNGDVFLSPGNNNSGSVKTSDDNCVINSIFHRMVWNRVIKSNYYGLPFRLRAKYLFKPLNYQEFCFLMTFGDDSTESINEEFTEFYNFSIFKEYFAVYGIEVTPSKKTDGDYLVKGLEELEFLKRGFKPTEIEIDGVKHNWVLAPLALTSVYKPLCWQVASKVVSSEAQTISAISSVNRELWMHGKALFEERRPELIKALEELGDFSGIESFDDISRIYRDDSFATYDT